jgi:hypothetical protein
MRNIEQYCCLITLLLGVSVTARKEDNIVPGHDYDLGNLNLLRVDVSSVLKTGENTLEVDVTNLWINRLIGDAGFANIGVPKDGFPKSITEGEPWPKDSKRKSFVSFLHQKKDDPLVPSGLLGPVTLYSIE